MEAGSNFSVSFQPAGGWVIPKRGSEQLEIRNKNLKKEGDRRSSWFRFIPKLFVEQFNRHLNLREDINRKNATFDT